MHGFAFSAGIIDGAQDDVDRGLAVQFNEPGLLELKGVLRAAAGDHKAALDLFDTAIYAGAVDRIHLHKAAALVALGQVEKAVQEWSLALETRSRAPRSLPGSRRATCGCAAGTWRWRTSNRPPPGPTRTPRSSWESSGPIFSACAIAANTSAAGALWHCGPRTTSTAHSQFGPATPPVSDDGWLGPGLLVRPTQSAAFSRRCEAARSQLRILLGATRFDSRGKTRRRECDLSTENHFGKRRGSEVIRSGNSGPEVNPSPSARPHAALTKSGHSKVSGAERKATAGTTGGSSSVTADRAVPDSTLSGFGTAGNVAHSAVNWPR